MSTSVRQPEPRTRLGADLIAFLVAKAVSDIGYALDFVCLSIFVYERTKSALATGLVSVALYGGAIIGGRLGHRFGDQWDRRRVMIGADLLRMTMLTLLAVLPDRTQNWLLYLTVFLIGVGRSVFEATLSAATPVLAGGRTQLVNSMIAGFKGMALVLGMGLATVVVPLIGFRGVFGLDAASYALSALVLISLRLRMREAQGHRRDTDRASAAWPLLIAAGLVPLIAVRGLDALGSSSQHVGLPILGSQLRPDAPTVVAGPVWGIWAAGLLVASFVLRPLVTRTISRSPEVVFCVTTMMMSAGFIGVFWLEHWWLRLVSAGVAGLSDALSEITFKQALQQLPDDQRGRVFGLSQVFVNGGFMIGLVLTSAALTPARLPEWVLLLHGVPFAVAGWTALKIGWVRRVRESVE